MAVVKRWPLWKGFKQESMYGSLSPGRKNSRRGEVAVKAEVRLYIEA